METKPLISVIIPAYNEEPILHGSLGQILQTLNAQNDYDWELLLVNDGSQDQTGAIMEEVRTQIPEKITVIHHRTNYGQGRGLRTAFAYARGDYVVTMDADLSYSPDYICKLVGELETSGADIALASPYMPGGQVRNVPRYRYILSRYGNTYLSYLNPYKISTVTCVVRAYRREVIDSLFLGSDGMEINLEVLAKANLQGFKVVEVPAVLEWAPEKAKAASLQRTSKMRILRTMRSYLLAGLFFRPVLLFMLPAFILLITGLYMGGFLFYRFLKIMLSHPEIAFLQNISQSFAELFANYTYSIAFAAIFLLVGLQFLSAGFVVLQNKIYFEELYQLGQELLRRQKQPLAVPFQK